MFPRKFDYASPGSLDEVTSALNSVPNAKVLSGGMSLLPLMKLRLLSPDLIVDIGRIPGLDRIEQQNDEVVIGARVTHRQTAESDLLPTALRQAAAWTGDVQVRNWGTTVGSVAHADLAADQPGAILALNATMVAVSTTGEREIAASEFFVDTLTTALEENEVLKEIRISDRGGVTAYDKLGRRGGHSDYAVAGAAVWVQKSNGSVSDCRVALTGVGSKPMLAPEVAESLIGTDGSPQAVKDASVNAVEERQALEDLYGSAAYKTHLAKVMTARALNQALGNS